MYFNFFFFIERRRSGGDSSGHSNHNRHSPNRKLDFEPHTPSTIKIRRKASESDNSSRKRSLRSGSERVALKFTSSSSSDSDDDIEMRNLLEQSKMRLENTQALRKHSHLLRPEDYVRNENDSQLINNCFKKTNQSDSDFDKSKACKSTIGFYLFLLIISVIILQVYGMMKF